jgi:hypothetical protein
MSGHQDIPDHIVEEESTGETPSRFLEMSPDDIGFQSTMEF